MVMAYRVMAYIVMAYRCMAYMVVACRGMAIPFTYRSLTGL